jgi:exopolysaccharide biosynthesis protein
LGARLWDAQDAIGAGPTLISDGQIVDTYENEVFFGSGFTSIDPYPRAAVGYTRDNRLILFATDGKQPQHSVGMTLARLSTEMQKLGSVEAMNLDGGGSETLVVNGVAINHPSDGRERNVSTCFAIVPATALVPQSSTQTSVSAPTPTPVPTATPATTPTPVTTPAATPTPAATR